MSIKFSLRVVSVLGFLTSAILTYLAYVPENAVSYERFLGIAMTIVCQGGGFLFLQLAFEKKLGTKFRIFFSALSIILFSLSIVATIDYQTKKDIKINNEKMVKSEQFIQTKDKIEKENKKFEILELQIDSLNKKIKDKEFQNNKEINEILKDMNSDKTAQWRKEQIGITLKETKKTQTAELKILNENLEKLNNKFQKFKFTEIDKNKIQNVVDENPIASKIILKIFFAVTFELTAVGAHIALKKFEKQDDIVDKFKSGGKRVINSIPTAIEKIPTLELKKQVPAFNSETKFTKDELKIYMSNMYETSKNKISAGYKKLGKLSDLNEGIAKEIHKYLQEKGIVKVIDGRTKIIIEE